METHTQCLLVTDAGIRYVAWIPTIRAKLNKVRIDGMVYNVKERYSTMPTDDVLVNSNDYRNHRKATDISDWNRLKPIEDKHKSK